MVYWLQLAWMQQSANTAIGPPITVLTATPGPPYSKCMRLLASSVSNSHRTFWRFQTTWTYFSRTLSGVANRWARSGSGMGKVTGMTLCWHWERGRACWGWDFSLTSGVGVWICIPSRRVASSDERHRDEAREKLARRGIGVGEGMLCVFGDMVLFSSIVLLMKCATYNKTSQKPNTRLIVRIGSVLFYKRTTILYIGPRRACSTRRRRHSR